MMTYSCNIPWPKNPNLFFGIKPKFQPDDDAAAAAGIPALAAEVGGATDGMRGGVVVERLLDARSCCILKALVKIMQAIWNKIPY